MKTITLMDSMTRIKGQLKVEISIDTKGGQQQIVDARCTGKFFRGPEILTNVHKPSDAPIVNQHICGVCPISHSQAAVLALENVSNWRPPTNARLLRNLTLGANFLQSHILQFYLMTVLDYVTVPATSPWASTWNLDMRPGLEKVAANLPAALGARRRIHEMDTVFGDKTSGRNICIPGGFTAIPTHKDIGRYRQHLLALIEFIESTYLPDVQLVGTAYNDYFEIGSGCQNLMAYGAFEMDNDNHSRLFRGGYIEKGKPDIQGMRTNNDIREAVQYSWNTDQLNNQITIQGDSHQEYPKDETQALLKPHDLPEKSFEGGPLARMWINGDYQRTISVMDRHVARALEAVKIATAMTEWLDELIPGENAYDDSFEQQSGYGLGLSEAPRGGLGHCVKIAEGKIADYQVITPNNWNASPDIYHDIAGPMNQALIGTAINNPEQPIEALRVIHSFDPCLSCARHSTQNY